MYVTKVEQVCQLRILVERQRRRGYQRSKRNGNYSFVISVNTTQQLLVIRRGNLVICCTVIVVVSSTAPYPRWRVPIGSVSCWCLMEKFSTLSTSKANNSSTDANTATSIRWRLRNESGGVIYTIPSCLFDIRLNGCCLRTVTSSSTPTTQCFNVATDPPSSNCSGPVYPVPRWSRVRTWRFASLSIS